MANPIEDRTSRSLSRPQSRAAVFVRLLSLAHGTSRVRREVVELLCSVLNKNIVPTVHFSTGDGPALIEIANVATGTGMVVDSPNLEPISQVSTASSGLEATRHAGGRLSLHHLDFRASQALQLQGMPMHSVLRLELALSSIEDCHLNISTLPGRAMQVATSDRHWVARVHIWLVFTALAVILAVCAAGFASVAVGLASCMPAAPCAPHGPATVLRPVLHLLHAGSAGGPTAGAWPIA